MSKGKSLILVAATVVCAWPIHAAAQTSEGDFMIEEAPERKPVVITTSSVEAGVGWVSTDSFKFGEYSGLEDKGPFGIGNIDVSRRSPYDGDSTQYWELFGTNLGLTSRSVHGEFGHQGTFKIFGDFDQIPHFRLDDAETPFIGAGSTELTLPPGWVPAADAPDLPVLDANLRGVEIETERDRYGGGFSWNVAKGLELSGSYRREDKDGLETIAGIFGTNGGNPRSAILPKPIDYTTQDADVILSYTRPKLQAQLGYHLSLFDDKADSLTWANPYDSSWDPSQDFDLGGQGRLALEPDNSAHNISVSGAYLLAPMTRVTGSFAYGRMFQDDSFLPYTINSSLASPVALPRDSLDGDVTTLHGTLGFAAQPLPKTDFDVKYTYDERDNNTPRDIYLTIPNDSADQGAIDGSRARINRPYSRQTHKVEVDGGYQVLPSTKVGLGYDFETVGRDFTEVADTYEHTGRVKVRSAPFSYASGWVEYAFSSRDGSDYVSNEPFLASHTDPFIAGEPAEDLFENNPFLRKFYIADRRRHLVKGAITVTPHDQVTLGLSGSYNMSDYHNTVIGLTDMTYGSVTGDATFMPIEQIALSGFVTFERGKYESTGYDRDNIAIVPTDTLLPERLWKQDATDRALTAGAEVEWIAIKDRLTFAADYTYSRTVTDFEFEAGSAVNPGAEDVPDLTTTLHSFGVRGEYKIQDDLAVRLGYRLELYDTDDFALDGIDEAIPRVLTLGNSSPDYTAHVIWSSVVFHF